MLGGPTRYTLVTTSKKNRAYGILWLQRLTGYTGPQENDTPASGRCILAKNFVTPFSPQSPPSPSVPFADRSLQVPYAGRARPVSLPMPVGKDKTRSKIVVP